jgi:hypothetical protein
MLKNMKIKYTPPEMIKVALWACICTAFAIITIVIYHSRISAYLAKQQTVCTYNDLGPWLAKALAPSNWFAIAAITLLIYFVVRLYLYIASKYTVLRHFSKAILAILALCLLLVIGANC